MVLVWRTRHFSLNPYSFSGTGEDLIVYDLMDYDVFVDYGEGDSGLDHPANN